MRNKQELIRQWRSLNIDERLLKAFEETPREQFVPASFREHAYDDHPLPTVRAQSISQPTTVMLMLQALNVKKGNKVLEVGSGGGYQAALISKVIGPAGLLVSLEVIPELVGIARENLSRMGLANVQIMEGDGGEGFPEEAPYDNIIITAACPTIPEPLIAQLKEGGIIIAPVGDLESQMMVRGVKEHGKMELEFLGSFMFVPMRGRYGFKEE